MFILMLRGNSRGGLWTVGFLIYEWVCVPQCCLKADTHRAQAVVCYRPAPPLSITYLPVITERKGISLRGPINEIKGPITVCSARERRRLRPKKHKESIETRHLKWMFGRAAS